MHALIRFLLYSYQPFNPSGPNTTLDMTAHSGQSASSVLSLSSEQTPLLAPLTPRHAYSEDEQLLSTSNSQLVRPKVDRIDTVWYNWLWNGNQHTFVVCVSLSLSLVLFQWICTICCVLGERKRFSLRITKSTDSLVPWNIYFNFAEFVCFCNVKSLTHSPHSHLSVFCADSLYNQFLISLFDSSDTLPLVFLLHCVYFIWNSISWLFCGSFLLYREPSDHDGNSGIKHNAGVMMADDDD